ncbi:hypothetical protein [Pedobacter sp. HMWF019]|uniref:hypothetical protein n=1 Tax=Pedobacter sp. HMWF019 TaxID=2056856 RepID=UPI0011B2A060|nr:hypothetical protein [Pedobacter sp. HMWF019]
MKTTICCLMICAAAFSLQAQTTGFSLDKASSDLPYLDGKPINKKNLYVTAGDRLYCIGDQEGNYPATGFHVKGEMGGIWQQPIKLMDGFRAELVGGNGYREKLQSAERFKAGSFVNKHIYHVQNQHIKVVRTQFVPDGLPVLVVEYAIENTGKISCSYSLDFLADVNLRPVWLGEENGMPDYPDKFYRKDGPVYSFKDGNNDWFTLLSCTADLTYKGISKTPYQGKGLTARFSTKVAIPGGQTKTVRFYISGSEQNYNLAVADLSRVKNDLAKLVAAKKDRYRLMENTASLDVPDAKLKQAWFWGKYSTDWLIRDVPSMGRAMSAGLPDYPWFFSNDQGYTFKALTGMMKPDLFYSSWAMLKKLSMKANGDIGRVIHEASANGVVYDKGRMEESQVHIETAWSVFKWTGNLEFLKENYAYAKKSLKWLMEHDTNGNLFVEGYGGVEIKGLNEEMLDVAVHTQGLFTVMSQMAAVLKDQDAISAYQTKADTLRARINRDWWIPKENRYADFITSKEKALDIIDTAIAKRIHPGRNTWALKKLNTLRSQIVAGTYKDKGYLVYYNTSGVLPLREGIADSSMAKKMLANMDWFTNQYGAYISGIERPDDIRADEGSVYARNKGEFSYDQAVMPAATSSFTIAECRYGSADSAMNYIHKTLNSFGFATPGTTYEVSPDYGMFVQAWNITGLYIPVIQYFFGIDPQAYLKEITIAPKMPVKWPYARLKNLLIGGNVLSVDYKKEGPVVTYKVDCTEPGWKINFLPGKAREVYVNGKAVNMDHGRVILDQKNNTITYKEY